MNQNWNWLNPRKTIYILKIVSQYFCYLVFWILRSLMFFTLSIFLSNKHLPMKTFSNIFFLLGPVIFVNFCIPFMFYYCQQSLIYIKSFFITIAIKWCCWWYCWYCFWWYCWWSEFFSVFFWSWIHVTIILSIHPCSSHWSRITVLRTTATVLNTWWNA